MVEEEKKQKLAELQERLARKRAEKAALEEAERKKNELIRRKTGQEMVQIKEQMKEAEMRKALEQKKREKEEEKLARQRVREQIEADKRARAEKVKILYILCSYFKVGTRTTYA